MLNPTIISDKLYGLVGIRQPYNPDYQKINTDNQGSRSGYFVTDNPLVKAETIIDSQDYQAISETDLNAWLKIKQQESIVSVGNAVFNRVDHLDRQVLYKNATNKIDTETLPDGFVGYRIQVSSKKNIAFQIKRVLLDFEGTGDIELLLFNTSQKAPIQSQVITISTDHEEYVLDWAVDNSGGLYKGDYYLGYLTNYVDINDLVPYKREYNNADIESLITDLCITRIKVAGHSTNTLFDLDDEDGLSETTGLNPDITVYEDFTDLMIQNESMFARAIQLDMQVSFLSEIFASIRVNRNERISAAMLDKMRLEVEGFNDGRVHKVGIKAQLKRSIETVRDEIDKLREGYFGEEIFVETLG